MKSYVALALASTALAFPQMSASSGCAASASGTFEIETVNQTSSNSKRDLASRQSSGVLTLTLQDGVLTDQDGRTGYIASNEQFQFNTPVQSNALETDGFALCSNNSLALTKGDRTAGDTTFFSCLSGDFYNLYAVSQGGQCTPIYIQAVNKASASGAVSQISDGQPQATSLAASVTQVVSQISDGQPQAATPAASVTNVVSEISDGQPQAATPAASVTNVVSQISDGQPQAGAAATSVASVVSQVSSGMPQASLATNGTTYNATATQPAEYTGAAASNGFAAGALAAGFMGLFAML